MSRHSRASSLRGRPWESFTEKGSGNDWGPVNQVIYDARREPTDYCPRGSEQPSIRKGDHRL